MPGSEKFTRWGHRSTRRNPAPGQPVDLDMIYMNRTSVLLADDHVMLTDALVSLVRQTVQRR